MMLENFIKTYAGVGYQFVHTAMVRHNGVVVAFAMDTQRRIYYAVLDLSGDSRDASVDSTNDRNPLDVAAWPVMPTPLEFPPEIAQVGYGLTDQVMLPVFKSLTSELPEPAGTALPADPDTRKTYDLFRSTTARLSALAPFQVLSDGQHVFLFRQAVAAPGPGASTEASTALRKAMVYIDRRRDDLRDASRLALVTSADGSEAKLRAVAEDGFVETLSSADCAPIVDATLLVDRFVLVETQLQPKLEVRFQRSRSKTRPQSRKDSLGAKDLDGTPFYEPTQELRFVSGLTGGRFNVLLVPTELPDHMRWQIFAHNTRTGMIDSYDVERARDGLFNTRGSQIYTCEDHPEVYALAAGSCGEPSLADQSASCGKALVPRISTRGHAESALELNLATGAAAPAYVELNQAVDLGPQLSLETWIKPAAPQVPGLQALVGAGATIEASRANADAGLAIWLDQSRLLIGFGDGERWGEHTTRSLLSLDSWNHLAVALDGEMIKVFVNGVLRDQTATTRIYVGGALQMDAAQSPPTALRMAIGGRSVASSAIKFFGASAGSFGGVIDEVRLWKRVRREAELRADMHRRLVGTEPGLAGYWRFDEARGATVYDQTDGAAHGQLISPSASSWVASDAPLGEQFGVSRSSFRIEGRQVAAGMTALLYHQQEPVTGGYAGTAKPLKQSARVMLAVPTGDGTRNEIAVLDMGVARSGRLAQLPDVVSLTRIDPQASNSTPINQRLEQIGRLHGQARALNEDVASLDRRRGVVGTAIGALENVLKEPPIQPELLVGEFASLNERIAACMSAHADSTLAAKDLEELGRELDQAAVMIYEHDKFGGSSTTLHKGTYSKTDITLIGQLSSLTIPTRTLQASLRRGNSYLALFQDTPSVGADWNDQVEQVIVAESSDYMERRERVTTRLAKLQSIKDELTGQKNRLSAIAAQMLAEQSAKEAQRDSLRTELDQTQDKLLNGASASMFLVHTDQAGLTVSGAVLGFAWTNQAPLLYDSATGNLALYFRGADDQFFVTYYETYTERARYQLNDTNGQLAVTCVATSADPEMDKTTIVVSGDADAATCTITISGLGITETWREVPRDPLGLEAVLNGDATEREYIGSGALARGEDAAVLLALPAGSRRPLAAGATLMVGDTRVILAERVERGAHQARVTTEEPELPAVALPVFYLRYDYERLASTTHELADLYNGSLLVRAMAAPEPSLRGLVAVDKTASSKETRSCNWTAAAPGTTLAFDGKTDVAFAADGSAAQFAAPGDLSLEAWVRPNRTPDGRAWIVRQQSDGSSYGLGLERREVRAALTFDGIDDYVNLGAGYNPGAGGWTVELWFRCERTEGENIIYNKEGVFEAAVRDGQFQFAMQQHWHWTGQDFPVVAGEWYHAAVSYDGAKQRVYRNGKLVFERDQTGSFVDNAQPLLLGDRTSAGSRRFKGQIDEFRLWWRAQGEADILADMERRLSGAEPGLAGYWRFDTGEVEARGGVPNGILLGFSGEPNQRLAVSPLPAYAPIVYVNQMALQGGPIVGPADWSHLAATFDQSYGLQFDGAGGYLDCGTDMTLDISRELTIEAFLKLDSTEKPVALLSKGSPGDADVDNDVPYALFIAAGGKVGLLFETADHRCFVCYSDQAIGTGFAKIAVTRKRGETREDIKQDDQVIGQKIDAYDEIRFYINGAESGYRKFKSLQPTDENARQPLEVGSSGQALTIGRSFAVGAAVDVGVLQALLESTIGKFSGESPQDRYELLVDEKKRQNFYDREEGEGSLGHLLVPAAAVNAGSLKGALGEVRIWGSARAAEQIGRRLRGNEKGLISWWQFEENQGRTALDGKSSNHGSFKGSLKWVKDPDPQGSRLTLYHNGVALTRVTVVAPPAAPPTSFSLGGSAVAGGYAELLQGELEELRVWETARTAEQIQDNLFRRLLDERDALIAYYTFDPTATASEPSLLADHGARGNDLGLRAKGSDANQSYADYVLSTAPIGEDTPQVRSALAGLRTPFSGRIGGPPAVAEYGDMQYDAANNLIGVYKRCYSYVREGRWELITAFKVGDLVTEWVGQVQFNPELIGYIEGAPPAPSENLAATGAVLGEFADYTGASAVELAQADEVTYTYSASREKGWDMAIQAALTTGFESTTDVGIGVITSIEKTKIKAGLRMAVDFSQAWLNDASTGISLSTNKTTRMEMRGVVENADAIAYPAIGRRFVPDNYGMALVRSETADVFALRLKHSGVLVAFQMRPNPDIPPDRNIITFPLNPRYTKQGVLDGKVGFTPDPDYPNAHEYSPDISYFKPIDAYALKARIERETARIHSAYEQYDAEKRGLRRVAYGSADDLLVGSMLHKLPRPEKRNIVNSYVWTAQGGLYAETEQSMDVFQESAGGSYSFKAMGGLELTIGLAFKVAMNFDLSAMFGGHQNLTVSKSTAAQRGFQLNVDLGKVESDLYLRTDDGKVVMDDRDPLRVKPALRPGRVDAYRFMSFFLEQSGDNHDLFFNRVVDPIWLEQSDEPNARALREARSARTECWRILHRVTYVSRILPRLSDSPPASLERTMRGLDIDSNYELIRLLEPYVAGNTGNYADFRRAVSGAITAEVPELRPFTPQIVQSLSLYFGVTPVGAGTGQEILGQEAPRERSPNRAPAVSAGDDKRLGLELAKVTTTLEGAASDDRLASEEAIFVSWSQAAGPGEVEFSNPYGLKTDATFRQRGRYSLRLTASDGTLSSEDTAIVYVNVPPEISAGPAVSVAPRRGDPLVDGKPSLRAELRGRIEDDGLGDPMHGVITLEWSAVQPAGTVTFENARALHTGVSFDRPGNYLLRLRVSNGTCERTSEVAVSVAARVTAGLEALYTFEQISAGQVPDVSGVQPALDLTIGDDQAVEQRAGSLSGKPVARLSTAGPAQRLVEAIVASDALTVEAWISPASPLHGGLARILTLGAGPASRNLIIGQSRDRYYVGLRITSNGVTDTSASLRALTTGAVRVSTGHPTHLACTRDANGELRIYLDGNEVARRVTAGSFAGWDSGFRLALGNEPDLTDPSGQRSWAGAFHLVALYSRALSADEVWQNYSFGADADLPPLVSAGANAEIGWKGPLPVRHTLRGSIIHDRPSSEQKVQWSLAAGPPDVMIDPDTSPIAAASFSQPGRYILRLSASDDVSRSSDETEVLIHVPPVVSVTPTGPVALLDGSVPVSLEGRVLSSGLGYDKGEGKAGQAPLDISWRRSAGPASAALRSADQLHAEVTIHERGVYTFTLRVDNRKLDLADGSPLATEAPLIVTANQPPQLDVGPPLVITMLLVAAAVPTMVGDASADGPGLALAEAAADSGAEPRWQARLALPGGVIDSGLGDPAEILQTRWRLHTGRPEGVVLDQDSATFSEGGVYVLRLSAGTGPLERHADLTVYVNRPPVVDAGPAQIVTWPEVALLDATVSDDGLPLSPGSLSLLWSQQSGPEGGVATFAPSDAISTTAGFSRPGDYILRLTADDGAQQSQGVAFSEVAVIVNAPPVVQAGDNQLVTLPPAGGLARANLRGSVSDDGRPRPTSVSQVWRVLRRPADASADFADPSAAETSVAFSAPGRYLLQLGADDGAPRSHGVGSAQLIVDVTRRVSAGLELLYTFRDDDMSTSGGQPLRVRDVAWSGAPFDLELSTYPPQPAEEADPAVVRAAGALEIRRSSYLAHAGPPQRLIAALRASNAITIEAWITPANSTQKGPARIITLSANTSIRCFTLGQIEDQFVVRLRTTETNINGSDKTLEGGQVMPGQKTHLVYTRDADGHVSFYQQGVPLDLTSAARQLGGTFEDWGLDNQNRAVTHRFVLANEYRQNPKAQSEDRTWLGAYHLVAIYSRALSADEVAQNHAAGQDLLAAFAEV